MHYAYGLWLGGMCAITHLMALRKAMVHSLYASSSVAISSITSRAASSENIYKDHVYMCMYMHVMRAIYLHI
jgi:hypothetical protein